MVNPNSEGVSNLHNDSDEDSQKPPEVPEEQVPLVDIKDPSKIEEGNTEVANDSTVKKANVDFQGLTKEQLEEFVKNPFWRRLRLIFFILFWVVWVSMLAAVIIIIVLSPKCPPRPKRQFWQRPVYRLQVKSFAPTTDAANPDVVGSLEGLALKMDYLRQTVGFNNFILSSLVSRNTVTGCPSDFKTPNADLGSLDTLRSLTKQGRKKGFNFLMEFDASQADIDFTAKAGVDSFYEASGVDGDVPMIASRNGGKAWVTHRLHLPRKSCPSLNVTSPEVLAKLEEALAFWLDAGLSGFVLTNVAFMSPTPLKVPPAGLPADSWFAADPTPLLFSNDSVDFVRSIRRFINAQAEKRGRELALFVDPGNTGFPQPEARLAAYLDPTDGAHAVISTGLGIPLSPLATRESRQPIQLVQDTLKAVGGSGSVSFATAWPSLRRPNDSFWTALSLTLPGVPCLYYGQEVGMAHVSGVHLSGKGSPSYLSGEDSTDAAETPMQWTDNLANAGWLANETTPLAWVDLAPRAVDIERHNLRRLSSAGHPASELQLVERLAQLISTKESLQWGELTFLTGTGSADSADLIAFKRQAERFLPVVVVVNAASRPATLDLSGAGSPKGTLKVLHSSAVGGASSSYQVDQDYSFDRVFAPAKSILVFLGKDAE